MIQGGDAGAEESAADVPSPVTVTAEVTVAAEEPPCQDGRTQGAQTAHGALMGSGRLRGRGTPSSMPLWAKSCSPIAPWSTRFTRGDGEGGARRRRLRGRVDRHWSACRGRRWL